MWFSSRVRPEIILPARSDWYANNWISTDVTLSLRHAIPPAQRCLVNVPGKPLTWRFPDDYPKCVGDRMVEAFPQLRR